MSRHERTLLRLALCDRRLIDSLASGDHASGDRALDARTVVLLRIAVLVALDASSAHFSSVAEEAFAAGVSIEEMVEVLTAIGGTVGSARVVAAAPRLAAAVGYDLDAALESSAVVEE